MFKRTLTVALTLCLFGVEANALTPDQIAEAALEAQIVALQAQVTALQKQLTVVQSANSVQTASGTALQTTVANLTNQLVTVQKNDTALQNTVTGIQTADTAQNVQLNALQTASSNEQAQLTVIENNPVLLLGPFVTLNPNPEIGVIGPNITFHGANIHIVSGSGATDDNGNPTGLGNLIIGYDENPLSEVDRTLFAPADLAAGDRGGSHNLIIGRWNRFLASSFGGIIGGEGNWLSGEANSLLGGEANRVVQGHGNVVVGGVESEASGTENVIVGGGGMATNTTQAVVLGGLGNSANAPNSVIVGGFNSYIYPSALVSVILGGSNVAGSVAYSILPNPIVNPPGNP